MVTIPTPGVVIDVFIEPSVTTVAVGDMFQVAVNFANNGQETDTAGTFVTYDQTKMTPTGVILDPGGNYQFDFTSDFSTPGRVDCGVWTPSSFPTESYQLCLITFTAIATVSGSPLSIVNTGVFDSGGFRIGVDYTRSMTGAIVNIGAALSTATQTLTRTLTPTPTIVAPILTASPSSTPSNVPTATPSVMTTPTSTATSTRTNSSTATPTASPTMPPSDTVTPTVTPSQTETHTPTSTSTMTETPTNRPTETPTATPSDTPTLTPSETPMATPTGTVLPTHTATRTPTPCPGDCDGDGDVTIDEVLVMVNVALGSGDGGGCLAGDTDRDGFVTVDEILSAVGSVLTGCHSSVAAFALTPNDTPTESPTRFQII